MDIIVTLLIVARQAYSRRMKYYGINCDLKHATFSNMTFLLEDNKSSSLEFYNYFVILNQIIHLLNRKDNNNVYEIIF